MKFWKRIKCIANLRDDVEKLKSDISDRESQISNLVNSVEALRKSLSQKEADVSAVKENVRYDLFSINVIAS
jgi:predicted  nucleic acid-binding Zn-ribbon protein